MVDELAAVCKASAMPIAVRPACSEDGSALREIERSAGERFRDVGLFEVADDEPASTEVLARYATDGRSWVAVDDADSPIGYVLVDVVDGNAHVEQVSVHPVHQGAGWLVPYSNACALGRQKSNGQPSRSRRSPTCRGTGPFTNTSASGSWARTRSGPS
jgi:hypothetical protein